MSLPLSPNTTCDIYRVSTAPPATPASANVPCCLRPAWRVGQRVAVNVLVWTHILHVDANVDLRDSYAGEMGTAEKDSVYIPDRNGTHYKVVFVERVGAGTAYEHKRAYLDRQQPAWPTNAL